MMDFGMKSREEKTASSERTRNSLPNGGGRR